MSGICAAPYWHNPWLQCTPVKSCRAESPSDAHFLFSPIDYSFLSWQISPEASSEPDKCAYNKQTQCVHVVCVCVCYCGWLGHSLPLPHVMTHKAETYWSAICAFQMCVLFKRRFINVGVRRRVRFVCVGSVFPVTRLPKASQTCLINDRSVN